MQNPGNLGIFVDLSICVALARTGETARSKVWNLLCNISDTGNIMHDIELYVNEKRKNVSIKFTSFCKKNFLAPLETKIKVLNTCVSAALTYGCET